MSKELQVFDCQEFGQVRVIEKDGKPMFVASDIARALGYANPAEAVQDHCKYAELLKTSKSLLLKIPPRGLLIIPESDIYRLIMRSTLPNAEKFECKVMEEILPTIAKTGSYSVQPQIAPDLMAQAVLAAKEILGQKTYKSPSLKNS